ncbi:MAG TPA: BamA/TamA family outer membrane protein [Balneolales bacterium]|nr:BamA/TamA family outer membrane protein [Balneolales bacterium]
MNAFFDKLCKTIPVFILIAVSLLINVPKLKAQESLVSLSKKDSVKAGVVPMLAYTSDLGLVYGVVVSRTDYRGNAQPFRSNFQTLLIGSTNGHIELTAKWDHTNTFGTNIRSSISPYFERIYDDYFFGIGNNTKFSSSKWKGNYYQVQTISFGVKYKGRKPLYDQNGSLKRLDLLLLAGSGYEVPYPGSGPKMFKNVEPTGYKGGWLNYVGTGLQWENRNNEFLPTHGNKGLFQFKYAPNFLLSDYNIAWYKASFTQYFKFHLIRDIVVAQRVMWNQVLGNAPFWRMAHLGDDHTLRGYPYYRFQGKASLIYNLELRTWLFSIPSLKMRIGGQLFMDSGKIYNNKANYRDFFGHYKRTFGLGGAMSLFNKDFFVRADLGFSPEMARIYAGIGYAF